MAKNLDEPLGLVCGGMEQRTLAILITAACEYLDEALEIRVTAKPLKPKCKSSGLSDLWPALGDQLDGRRVAIVGLEGRHSHGTVAYAITPKLIRLADPDQLKTSLRSRCTLKRTNTRHRLMAGHITLLKRMN